MVFNLPFQNVIYHPILGNNCNNVFPPVLSSRIVILLELFSKRNNHILHSLIFEQWNEDISMLQKADFPAHSMFTFDVFRRNLDTSIFENSSSAAANNHRPSLPSGLSFHFLWLCFLKFVAWSPVHTISRYWP